jgi:hypothetical protein
MKFSFSFVLHEEGFELMYCDIAQSTVTQRDSFFKTGYWREEMSGKETGAGGDGSIFSRIMELRYRPQNYRL